MKKAIIEVTVLPETNCLICYNRRNVDTPHGFYSQCIMLSEPLTLVREKKKNVGCEEYIPTTLAGYGGEVQASVDVKIVKRRGKKV